MMGEFQINNLSIILVIICIISLGILGFFELKKLFIKINTLEELLNEINDKITSLQQTTSPAYPEEVKGLSYPYQGESSEPPQLYNPYDPRTNREYYKEDIEETEDEKTTDTETSSRVSHEEDHTEREKSIERKHTEQDNKISNIYEDDQLINEDQQLINDDNDDDDDDDDDDGDDNGNNGNNDIELNNPFNNMSVKELKLICKEYGLKTSGPKKKIILRILFYINSQNKI